MRIPKTTLAILWPLAKPTEAKMKKEDFSYWREPSPKKDVLMNEWNLSRVSQLHWRKKQPSVLNEWRGHVILLINIAGTTYMHIPNQSIKSWKKDKQVDILFNEMLTHNYVKWAN